MDRNGGVTKEQVKAAMEDPSIQDLPDGAYWSLVHERLGLPYGRVFKFIAEDPEFFGANEIERKQ
jgi:hypothetical protein